MIPKTKTHARRNRLLSGAGTTLALTLAALPAHGQTVSGRATGDTVVTNAQSAASGIVLAQGDGAGVESVNIGPIAGSTVALNRNTMAGKARANSATLTLAPDPASAASRPTSLTAGATAIDAQANTLIANQQSIGSAEAVADWIASPISITARTVSDGTLEVTGNAQTAAAGGNAASSAIAVTGSDGNGAGVVSTQTAGPASGVAARVRRGITIDTGAISASGLTISGNSNDADAAGNAVDDTLSVSGAAIEAQTQPGFASRVPAIGSGSPSVSATFGVLSSQQAGGIVKARAGNLVDGTPDGGPAFRTGIAGNADDAAIASDGNTISANAQGNRAANRLSLSAPDISAAPGISGAIGNVTNVQSTTATGRIVASAHGGGGADVTGHLADSRLSISQNVRQTSAVANAASGNTLTVDAATADGGLARNDEALVGPNGDAVADAGFTVQNVQDYSTASILTGQAGPAARASVSSTILGSTIDLNRNSVTDSGIGNSAINSAQLDVTTLRASAAVNNVQSGNGSVTSELGTVADPGGMLIASASSIAGSTLTVADNDTTGSVAGNQASNALGITAATVQGRGAPGVTGTIGNDYGASGALVLASNQKLGQMSLDGSLTPTIASNVVSVSGVDGAGPVAGSTIRVEDNRQRAEALGNSADSRLIVSAVKLDGAGLALSASQYGQANVAATSDATLATRGILTGSAASLSGNSNVALAVVNQAANTLEADTATTSTPVPGAFVSADPLGPPFASGTAALANQQFATGSAQASASSRVGDTGPDDSLSSARFTIDGNATVAESAGNRVANSLGANASSGIAGAGLANSQTSLAQVSASAVTRAGYGIAASGATPIGASTVDVGDNMTSALARGNAADNAMTIGDTRGAGAAVSVDLRNRTAGGGAVLLNGQANYGAVTASAADSSYLVPLNATGMASGSTITIGGNAFAASAYGNSANNSVALPAAGAVPGVGITSFQTNYGGVTALVAGTGYQTGTGPLTGSALTITGNSLAATAVGNQATSAIASPR